MTTESSPRPTVLREAHVASGAKLVDFHGWEMPLRYRSIPEEHLAVRSSAGLFDLCHMGRIRFRGGAAEAWLKSVLTIDAAKLAPGKARYGFVLDPRGGVIDDTILYRLGSDEWLLVVNASNRERVLDWFSEHRPGSGAATMEDLTATWAMIAIQGPASESIVALLLAEPERPWQALRYYQVSRAAYAVNGVRESVLAARTGYTGEDGFEIYLPAELAESLWKRSLELAGARLVPVGLGARDTLRLEAGMPLYGNELDESTHPYEAGLGFAVDLDRDPPFIGQAALRKLSATGGTIAGGPPRRLRGFRLDGGRVPRQGMKIVLDESEVGAVTSGAPSPTLGCPIAMGFVQADAEARGADRLELDLRGRREKLAPSALPFYSRTRKKPGA